MGSLTCLVHVSVFLICFSTFSEAGNFDVSWKVSPKLDRLNHWASKMRFIIGDSLEFKFDPKVDSLLQVSEESYKTCNASNPVKTYDNGDTKIVLENSGPYYFISGVQDHCAKGLKMMVRVLSAKHSEKGHGAAPATSPATSPALLFTPKSSATNDSAHSGGVGVKSGGLGTALVVVSVAAMVLG